MTGSVTNLFKQLKQGNEDATADLFAHFMPRIKAQIARSAKQLRLHDEDDVAINAFFEFCKAVTGCHSPEKNNSEKAIEINDRGQLWQVLCVIAIRQANDLRKYESAQVRGGDATTVSLASWHSQLPQMDERPDVQIEMLEQCQHLLNTLSDEDLRKVAELKLQGYTNVEVANKMDVSKRTIQYMLNRIKDQLGPKLSKPTE